MGARQLVQDRRTDILRIAKSYGASNVRLFGSVRRNQDRPGSDVDFLVSMAAGATLLDLIGLEQDLAELLGMPVDVQPEGGISPYIEPHILSEAIAV